MLVAEKRHSEGPDYRLAHMIRRSRCRPLRVLSGASVLVPLVFVLLLVATSGPVAAHSFWPTFYSAKTTVTADGERLGVTVVVEVPVVSLLGKFRKYFSHLDLEQEIREGRFEALEDEFRAHQLSRLAAALELRLDGEAPAGTWQPVDTPVNGRANEGFFVYLLEFRPQAPPELGATAEVEVSNRVYEGRNIVFANYVDARGGWEVVESSTPQPSPAADLSPGSPDEIAMWSEEPERRRFRVVLRRDGASE